MKLIISRRTGLAALAIAAPLLMTAPIASAQTYAVTTRPGVEYVVHDGVRLTGDFYLPNGLDKAPVIVAVHGGGWVAGGQSGLAQRVGALHGQRRLCGICDSLPASRDSRRTGCASYCFGTAMAINEPG